MSNKYSRIVGEKILTLMKEMTDFKVEGNVENILDSLVFWWLISDLTINNNRNHNSLPYKIVGICIYFDTSTFKLEDVNIFF